MLAYFTASIVGKKHYLKNYLRIIDIIHSKKIQIISDHIINGSEQKITIETKDERIKFHQKLEKWISSSDFVVVEATFPSISVGYEISLALQLNKPTLILYSQGDPPSLLAHHHNDKLICEKYTLTTLIDIIEDFINFAEGKVDSRFTFFITPEIDLFLNKISKKLKLPKSVYLRRLIEKEIAK
jgi:hypothetical protein